MRHSSGIVIKKNRSNNAYEAFIFDSVGIHLVAQGCGIHVTQTKNNNLEGALSILEKKSVKVMITPINTVLALQNDWYSCFAATVIFFEAMYLNEYKIIDENDDDYTEIYGEKYNYKERGRYAISYFPLLAGVQNKIALFLMTDCLDNFNNSIKDIALSQANWNRKITTIYNNIKYENCFWQAAYIHLLNWFNGVEAGKDFIFPNLNKLALIKQSDSQEPSDLESFIEKLLILDNI